MTGGPSSNSWFFMLFLVFFQTGGLGQGDIWSSGIYLPDGFGFPFILIGFFLFGGFWVWSLLSYPILA